jgi:hypothetical protein
MNPVMSLADSMDTPVLGPATPAIDHGTEPVGV